jgi:vacuolar-type H+-ATPase subunit I/STV1
MAEEKYDVHPDIAKELEARQIPTEEIQEQPQEEQEEAQQEQQPAEEPKKPTKEEYNYVALREEVGRAQRERDEALRKLQELTPRKQPEPEEVEEDLTNPNDLVEGKTVNKLNKELRTMKKQLSQYQRQSNELAAESKVRAQYPDFDTVCSQENLEEFRRQYPELAESIISTGDIYKAAVSAYTAVKNMGIAKSTPAQSQEETIRMAKNTTRPRTSASISPTQGESPLSQANLYANGLTEELKAKLRKEMNDAAKNY